ncbi:MAG: hypothetical protein WC422_00555 [Candidatus Paceibacterota bacterium]|jgi:hypothetical protein
MKRVFKISNPKHLPTRVTIETDDEKLAPLINSRVEEWLAKFTKQLFPESFSTWEELFSDDEPYADDTTTTKDIGGSLDSFPPSTDDITDSSAT